MDNLDKKYNNDSSNNTNEVDYANQIQNAIIKYNKRRKRKLFFINILDSIIYILGLIITTILITALITIINYKIALYGMNNIIITNDNNKISTILNSFDKNNNPKYILNSTFNINLTPSINLYNEIYRICIIQNSADLIILKNFEFYNGIISATVYCLQKNKLHTIE